MSGDVLTKEERESLVQQLEMHLHHLHIHSDDVEHSLKKCGVWNLLREDYDRLVSEVELLRARNEALEKVAKVAHTVYLSDALIVADKCQLDDALGDALSALNPPSSGKEPSR